MQHFIQRNFSSLLKQDVHNAILFINKLRQSKIQHTELETTAASTLKNIENTSKVSENTELDKEEYPLLHKYGIIDDNVLLNNLLQELIRHKEKHDGIYANVNFTTYRGND